ncbi:MAG: citramalate synthase [Pelovirga sp.]
MSRVYLYDTTLRDGTQAEDISFQVQDKVRIAKHLDALGIDYIEGGWPGSNPKDIGFFEAIQKETLTHSKIAAFGSTRRARISPEQDSNIKMLIESRPDVVTIFGKTWDFHVREALRVSLEENLDMINDSLGYLKERVAEVIYDAEHFFDGYKANPDYALQTLRAAATAGADCLVLCDTNGGTLPHEIPTIIEQVRREIDVPLGIHAHNDSECAVANSLMAVIAGAVHVQGTMNGFGERCGNANLCSIIPSLMLKMNKDCLQEGKLASLRKTSRSIYELANVSPQKHQAYVGNSAFAHKGGVHVSAIQRHPETYEHIRPELVGNKTRVLVSDLSGRSNILAKAQECGIEIDGKDPVALEILEKIKELENQGYHFEGAEASFELLMLKAMGNLKHYFNITAFRVIDTLRESDQQPVSEATIKVKVGGRVEHMAADGNGPVNALDQAMRKALISFYPQLKDIKLLDYKVRVLPSSQGTDSTIRVLVETGDKEARWGTIGVSSNVIDASYQALADAFTYKLYKDQQ